MKSFKKATGVIASLAGTAAMAGAGPALACYTAGDLIYAQNALSNAETAHSNAVGQRSTNIGNWETFNYYPAVDQCLLFPAELQTACIDRAEIDKIRFIEDLDLEISELYQDIDEFQGALNEVQANMCS